MFNTYNPYCTPQQRLQQMEQQYANYTQSQMQPQPQPQGFRVIPVANIEEANATPVDTIGDTPSFFFNRAKNEIYLKQYNSQTGLPIFQTFHMQEAKTKPTVDNFKVLNDKIDGLYSLIEKEKKEGKNAK